MSSVGFPLPNRASSLTGPAGGPVGPPRLPVSWLSFPSVLMISTLLSLSIGCISSLDRQWVGVGVSGISSASARWEATLPTLGGDACDTPPWGLKASMAVYRVPGELYQSIDA